MPTPAAASGINPLDQANQIKALLTQTVPDATHEYSFTPQMLQHSPTFNLWTVNNVANDFGHQIANPTLLSHYYGVLDDDHLIRYVQLTVNSRSCMHACMTENIHAQVTCCANQYLRIAAQLNFLRRR